MKRIEIVSLVVLIAALPAATASSFFSSGSKAASAKPCFIAGSSGYQMSADTTSNYTVRIDNAALHPILRMQLVDSPVDADFVLVDDSEAVNACAGATSVKNIRIDNGAAAPDMTVALSREPADYKIYVRSAHFSDQDAAALFAVMWRDSPHTRRVAARD